MLRSGEREGREGRGEGVDRVGGTELCSVQNIKCLLTRVQSTLGEGGEEIVNVILVPPSHSELGQFL